MDCFLAFILGLGNFFNIKFHLDRISPYFIIKGTK